MGNIKLAKYDFAFVLIILIILAGSTHPLFTYIALGLCAVIAFAIGIHYAFRPKANCCMGIVYLLVFQNAAIGIGAHIAGNTSESLKLMTQIPFLTIGILWILFLLVNQSRKSKHMIRNSRILFLILLMAIGTAYLSGHGALSSILMNIRNLTVFFMTFEIGYHCIKSDKDFIRMQKGFLKLSLFILIVGIVLLITGYPGYEAIGIKEVYIAKGAPFDGEGLDGRFYTTLISRTLTRMGSLYYEPVNLGYFYAVAFLVAWFGNWTAHTQKRIIFVILNGLGLLLTFGKGAYLLSGTVILCVYGMRFLKRMFSIVPSKVLRRTAVSVMIAAVGVFCIYYYQEIGAASRPHFIAIMLTWQNVLRKPLGYGLGTGGNMAAIFDSNTDAWLASGGETALMSFMYQLGIQGVLIFGLCLISLSIKNNMKHKRHMDIFYYIPIVLLGISLMQDNTFTPQCITSFMLLQGGAKRMENSIKERRLKVM